MEAVYIEIHTENAWFESRKRWRPSPTKRLTVPGTLMDRTCCRRRMVASKLGSLEDLVASGCVCEVYLSVSYKRTTRFSSFQP